MAGWQYQMGPIRYQVGYPGKKIKKGIFLAYGGETKRGNHDPRLTVKEDSGAVTVVTGPLKFEVSKKAF